MNWKKFFSIFFSLMFMLVVIVLLVLYWFFPFNSAEFFMKGPEHSNFSLNVSEADHMQFYKNMRYPYPQISYKIEGCPLQKSDDMERAFDLIENITILEFDAIDNNEEISVTCDSRVKINEDFFIAGEGGPTNITRTQNFNVITRGSILLLRDEKCPDANIATHELLHALGFDHSNNPNNIMYNVTKCKQTIGTDIVQLIDEVYAYPSYADLSFEDVSAKIDGRFLNLNMSVRNNGLKKSDNSTIELYADEKVLKEFDLGELKIGVGRIIYLENFWISKIRFDKLELKIVAEFEELNKQNNKIILE